MKKYVYALLKSINLFRVPTKFLNTQVKVQEGKFSWVYIHLTTRTRTYYLVKASNLLNKK